MKKTIGCQQLEATGFKVAREYAENGRRGRWFDVVTPDGERGAVMRLSPGSWHFFSSDYIGTASGCTPDRCHRGCIGDVIDTNRHLNSYERAVLNAPQILLIKCRSLYHESTMLYNQENR